MSSHIQPWYWIREGQGNPTVCSFLQTKVWLNYLVIFFWCPGKRSMNKSKLSNLDFWFLENWTWLSYAKFPSRLIFFQLLEADWGFLSWNYMDLYVTFLELLQHSQQLHPCFDWSPCQPWRLKDLSISTRKKMKLPHKSVMQDPKSFPITQCHAGP